MKILSSKKSKSLAAITAVTATMMLAAPSAQAGSPGECNDCINTAVKAGNDAAAPIMATISSCSGWYIPLAYTAICQASIIAKADSARTAARTQALNTCAPIACA